MPQTTCAGPFGQARKIEFSYDGQGRRVTKKVSNWSPGGWVLASSTLFLYDGWNLLAELNALTANSVIRTYVWGLDLSGSGQGAGGVGGLLFSTLQLPVSTSTCASAYDGNGSVIGYVDMVTGNQAATYDYNAFGETLISDGSAAVLFPFRFSTKYTDTETGLLNYGLRYYSPSIGRWLSRDPIEENGGIALNALLGNDALNNIDLRGLVLFAVGGTGSTQDNADINNRTNVSRFFADWRGPGKKAYHEGPGTDALWGYGPGRVFGLGSSDIAEIGYQFICSELQKQVGITEPWWKDPVYLVGHSRGGAIVIEIAYKLQKGCPCGKDGAAAIQGSIPVQFMGLYDAVSMNIDTPSGAISGNVSNVVHGRRDPSTGSRSSWGNTGTEGGRNYEEQFFKGNHSAMGGEPGAGDRIEAIGMSNNVAAARAIDKYIRDAARSNGAILSGNP